MASCASRGTFSVHSESDDRRTSVARRRVSVQFLIAAARFHPVLELHNCVSFYIPSKLAVNWLLIMTDIQNIPIVEVRGWWFTVSFLEVTLNTDVFFSIPSLIICGFICMCVIFFVIYLTQWRRQGEGGKLPPYRWTSKNYVICVCFHYHGTSSYHTTNTLQGRRAKSHVDTQTIQPGLGDFVL